MPLQSEKYIKENLWKKLSAMKPPLFWKNPCSLISFFLYLAGTLRWPLPPRSRLPPPARPPPRSPPPQTERTWFFPREASLLIERRRSLSEWPRQEREGGLIYSYLSPPGIEGKRERESGLRRARPAVPLIHAKESMGRRRRNRPMIYKI